MDAPRAAAAPASGELTISQVLDTLGEGFVTYDRDWRITYMNRVAQGTLATAGGRIDLAGQTIWEAFPEVVGSSLEARYREAMASTAPVEFEAYSPISRRWFAFRAFPSADGLTVMAHDITASKQAADALRASEALLRALIDHSSEGILLTTPTGDILSANPAACRMLRRPEAEICALGRTGIIDCDDPRVAAMLELRARTGQMSGELTLIRGDGVRIPARVHSTIFVDAHERQRTSMSFEDLSEVRRAEAEQARMMQALRDSEERWRLAFEHAAIGKALCGLDGQFLEVNARMCEIVGYSSAELVARRFQDITHPDDLDLDLALMAALLRGETPRHELAKRYIRKDGALVDVRLSASLLRDRTGEPKLFIAEVQDVTEQKRLESRIALTDRMVSIGTLAGGLAHEINNPLAAVVANLELMAATLRAMAGDGASAQVAELQRDAEEARAGAERVRTIVRGMQAFVRAEREQREALDLHAILDGAIAVIANEIRHRAQLETVYGDVPMIEADAPRLTQVIINVLLNATEAIPEGHAAANQIRITTATDPAGRAVVEIADSGAGMSERVRARAFDPFFTTKDVGTGAGLGLSIAHAIVSALGGTIDATSAPGRGCVVRIALPAAPQAQAVAVAPPPAVVAASPVTRRGRVLILDDDVKVANVLGRLLHLDHDATIVYRGADAVARLAAGERYDVILCDVMMPEMTGPEVHAAIRQISEAQAARMVFITGGAFTPAARAFLEQVGNPRLDKPIDVEALHQVIRGLMA